MNRTSLRWIIPILGLFLVTIPSQAQHLSRQQAIDYIATRYPNSTKSPEQIYDEGQIERTLRQFTKRFGNWELSALTGPLAEDSIRVINVKKRPPVVRTADVASTPADSIRRASSASPNPPETPRSTKSVSGDTTSQNDPSLETHTIQRRSAFYSKHPVVTTAKQDYNDQDRRLLRQNFLNLFKNLPPDVRIELKPITTTYHGQTATVNAEWHYDILGTPTKGSRPYANQPPGDVKIQLRRVGDQWLVSNFQGLLSRLNSQLASR